MRVLSPQELPPRLARQKLPTDGLCPLFNHLRYRVLLSDSLSTNELMRIFREFAEAMSSSGPLVLLCDGYSGWRYVPASVKTRALLVSDASEAEQFVRVRSYFRRNVFDNYYVCDESVAWVALFCHDDDVHFWLSARAWKRPPTQRWLTKEGLEPMMPW